MGGYVEGGTNQHTRPRAQEPFFSTQMGGRRRQAWSICTYTEVMNIPHDIDTFECGRGQTQNRCMKTSSLVCCNSQTSLYDRSIEVWVAFPDSHLASDREGQDWLINVYLCNKLMTHGVRHGFCYTYTLCFDILVRSKIFVSNRNAINIEYCYNCILTLWNVSVWLNWFEWHGVCHGFCCV